VPVFRLFGFPIRVKIGFLAFIGMVIAWNPSIGWKFGIAVTVFSLIHELGHAFAARRLGAAPEIALDFLAGSTRYTPPRPVSALERASVAATGPLLETVAGLLVLAVLRVNPLNARSVFDSTLASVVWIAGPVFGLLNLLPVLPLDGGHVLAGVLETISPRWGRLATTLSSAFLTCGFALVAVLSRTLRWLAPFGILLVVLQLWPVLPVSFWGRKLRRTGRYGPRNDDTPRFSGPEVEVSAQNLPENAGL
jgi:Zn-dependent protease